MPEEGKQQGGDSGQAGDKGQGTVDAAQSASLSQDQVQQVLLEHTRQIEERFATERAKMLKAHEADITAAKGKIMQYETELGLDSDEEKQAYRDSQFWREQVAQAYADLHDLSSEERVELLESRDAARMKRNAERMAAAKKAKTATTTGLDETVRAIVERATTRTASPGGGSPGRTRESIMDDYIKNPNAQTRKAYETIRAS